MSYEEFPLTIDPFNTQIGTISMSNSRPTITNNDVRIFEHHELSPTQNDWALYNAWRRTKTPQWGNPARTYLDYHDERDSEEGASASGKAKADLLNAVLGIVGESGELLKDFGPDYVNGEITRGVSTISVGENRVACAQELGDILFYCVWALDSLSLLFPESVTPVHGEVEIRIQGSWAINEVANTRTWKEKFVKKLQDHLIDATAIGELTKKFVFHAKPVHFEIAVAIRALLTDTILVGQSMAFGGRTLLALNIAKLDKRYTDGFVGGGGNR